MRSQSRDTAPRRQKPQSVSAVAALLVALCCIPGDARQDIYGILISNTYEGSWEPTASLYNTLLDKYGAQPENILVYSAMNATPSSHEEIMDGLAYVDSLWNDFARFGARMDADDIFIFLLEAHGQGYIGRDSLDGDNRREYGTVQCGQPPEIAGPDEPWEFIEREFEFGHRYLSTAMYSIHQGNIHCGIDRWCARTRHAYEDGGKCLRIMVKSQYTDLELENGSLHSDNDSLLEVVLDFPLGDFNRNGRIEHDSGETIDLDGDGEWAYHWHYETFDEDEWGLPDSIIDDFPEFIFRSCGMRYNIYDAGLDNQMDMDYNPTEDNWIADGTDYDGDGVMDGVDINGDGDKDDNVVLRTYAIMNGFKAMSDDTLRAMFDLIKHGTKIAIINSCQGGGFLNNLSAESTIVITGGNPYQYVGRGRLPKAIAAGLGDSSSVIDADNDGAVSMLELFNGANYLDMHFRGSAPSWQYYDLMFLLDDNADMVGHLYPLPDSTGDGLFASTVLLRPAGTTAAQHATRPAAPRMVALTWAPSSSGLRFATAPGAALTVYALDGRRVASFTSGSGGSVSWPGAVAGTYLVTVKARGKMRVTEKVCFTGR